MKSNRRYDCVDENKRKGVGVFYVWQQFFVCPMGFLFVLPCSAQKAPKGEAVVAISDPPL